MLENGRWRSTVACEDQIDPGIQEVIWQTVMAYDRRGSVWGPPHGVMRVRTSAGSWGWNREYAAKVQGADADPGRRAGSSSRTERATLRRSDRRRRQGAGDHGLRYPLRGLGEDAVQVHARGVAGVARAGYIPGTLDRALLHRPGRRGRRHDPDDRIARPAAPAAGRSASSRECSAGAAAAVRIIVAEVTGANAVMAGSDEAGRDAVGWRRLRSSRRLAGSPAAIVQSSTARIPSARISTVRSICALVITMGGAST